jgi:hypothetical protein
MKYYILTSPLKLKVEYSATLSLKSEIMMTAVAEGGMVQRWWRLPEKIEAGGWPTTAAGGC